MAGLGRPWTEAEHDFLAANCYVLSWEEIAERLSRTEAAVRSRAQAHGLLGKIRRVWTQKEVQQLQQLWGIKSVPKIAKILGRSEHSIRTKANELGLGGFIDNSNYFTATQIANLLGVSREKAKIWIRRHGLKS